MAEELTLQQKMAVTNRGGKLLVSAAAGSGKTKVLVDRIMSYLLDPVNPANLDEFLIITYTKAAASELRGKIAKKLSERIALQPENRHLQKQIQHLYLTKISTVHAFCGDILREYAYQLDLPADFRVAEENECSQVRQECMSRCLDQAYTRSDDADFRAFVDSQGLGRDDRMVPEILMQIYDRSRCDLNPEKWLNDCIANANVGDTSDAAQTIWGAYLMSSLKENVQMQISALSQLAQEAMIVPQMDKPVALLMDTVYQLNCLYEAQTWDEIATIGKIDYGRLVFSKNAGNPQLCEQIKAVRNACKKSLEKQLKSFSDSSAIVLEDLQHSASAISGMIQLVNSFEREFSRAKKAKRILDFSDLEHQMLTLLRGKNRDRITATAREIGSRFREVMVDEYQDSNAVQDAIFSALTEQRQNCFMVGDVKQSIYQFRLADPTIFLTKYHAYQDAQNAVDSEGRRVMLSSNFRSGGAVLEGINDIFRCCMTENVGGLVYGEEETLHEGIPHVPLGEPEVELWGIDVQESTYDEEASFVANRIAELIDGKHMVRDKEGLRPICAGDVAILLRSPGSMAGYFKNALEKQGIRCTTGGGCDLLQSQEVSVLRAILQTVSNPRQDIPLLAALASPVFGITAEKLTQIRTQNPYGHIYDALKESADPAIQVFLERLNTWRTLVRIHPLSRLLEDILLSTHMDSIYGAMPNGELRQTNIQAFYQLAVAFETTACRDLEQFLRHLDAMEEKGLILADDATDTNAVTVMSIHKSKGLEFPVVFVCGLSRSFNRESVRAQVLCDTKLGPGMSAVDEKNRVRYPSISKRAIAAKITAESLSEEMRVLYVALTRARDRLIMTYASQTLQKDLTDLVNRLDVGSAELLTQDATCMGDWVLMAALKRTEAGEFFALGGNPRQSAPGNPPWLIRVVQAPQECSMQLQEERKQLPALIAERLRERRNFCYTYAAATVAPSKQTATQRKGRIKDDEVSEFVPIQRNAAVKWRCPTFIEQPSDGAQMGTAMHAAMQYIRYDQCHSIRAVEAEIQRLVAENRMDAKQADMVDCSQIFAFFQTNTGKQLSTHPHVLREFKFSVLDDAAHFDQALQGEEILLQGVVDCAMIDADGIIIIDFKTDFVTPETIPQKTEIYRTQLMAYADAMSRIYQLPVKAAYLYFFKSNTFVCL